MTNELIWTQDRPSWNRHQSHVKTADWFDGMKPWIMNSKLLFVGAYHTSLSVCNCPLSVTDGAACITVRITTVVYGYLETSLECIKLPAGWEWQNSASSWKTTTNLSPCWILFNWLFYVVTLVWPVSLKVVCKSLDFYTPDGFPDEE